MAGIPSRALREHVARELARLDREALRRRTTAWPAAGGAVPLPDGRTLLNLSSNDYLALARDPAVVRRAGLPVVR